MYMYMDPTMQIADMGSTGVTFTQTMLTTCVVSSMTILVVLIKGIIAIIYIFGANSAAN